MKNEASTNEKLCDSNSRSHVCTDCDKIFSTKYTLKRHRKIHDGAREKTLECSVCGKRFARADYLTKHSRIHSGEKPYKCHVCDRSFGYLSDIRTHMRVHTGDKPYKCSLCDKRFRQSTNLLTHKRHVHSDTRPYLCPCCGTLFKTSATLKHHLLVHTGAEIFSCRHCEQSFTCSQQMKTHMLRSHNEDTWITCDSGFATESALKRHHKTHGSGKIYSRTEHEKRFYTQQNSRMSTNMHSCQYGERSRDEGAVTVHRRGLSGEKPFECHVCGKRFARADYLMKHSKNHSGEKPHKCHVCDKRFRYLSDIRTHMRVHTGDKPYKCSLCDKRFRQSTNLLTHKRHVHSDTRPYRCPCCGKLFKTSAKVKQHFRVHIGAELFSCRYCPQSFTCSQQLKTHFTQSHNEGTWINCDTGFATESALKRHRKTHGSSKMYSPTEQDTRFSTQQNARMPTNMHSCEYGEGSRDEGALTSHRRSRLGGKFAMADHRTIHSRIRSGEKPYKCHVCDRSFGYPSGIRTHMRVHTGDKPYKCSLCDKRFRQSTNLLTHKRHVHSDTRPYLCPCCGKLFKTSATLKQHFYVNTDAEPFSCKHCAEEFAYSSQLKAHPLKSHNEGTWFTCRMCHNKFSLEHRLMEPMPHHEGVNPTGAESTWTETAKAFPLSEQLQLLMCKAREEDNSHQQPEFDDKTVLWFLRIRFRTSWGAPFVFPDPIIGHIHFWRVDCFRKLNIELANFLNFINLTMFVVKLSVYFYRSIRFWL